MTSEGLARPSTARTGADLLEILVGPFFALIDAALDRPLLPFAAASMLGSVISILLMLW
jgi:hypothetical protein